VAKKGWTGVKFIGEQGLHWPGGIGEPEDWLLSGTLCNGVD